MLQDQPVTGGGLILLSAACASFGIGQLVPDWNHTIEVPHRCDKAEDGPAAGAGPFIRWVGWAGGQADAGGPIARKPARQ